MAAKAEQRRRAGPRRSEASKKAILEATRHELAASGWRSFSVDGVAKRASASKQTIYRWWPSIATLCAESVMSELPPRAVSATEPEDRLAELVQPLVQFAREADHQSALRGAILAAADDEGAREIVRAWLANEVRGPLRLILAELTHKGIIRRDWDPDEAMSAFLGPLWHRLMIANAPISHDFAQKLARNLISALSSS
jgi:AcrR family transcriptional regulator